MRHPAGYAVFGAAMEYFEGRIGVMLRWSLALSFVLAIGVPTIAQASLPACSDPDVASRARFQFNGSQELRKPPSPRRALALEKVNETARTPYTGPYAPAGYEARYCEGTLRLDDATNLAVFIRIVGRDGDGKRTIEALETCWEDARFPRNLKGCEAEKAPARR